MRIRPARPDEFPILQQIQLAAGRCFRDIDMPEVASGDPLSLHELARYQQAGLAWVTVDGADEPVAFLVADRVDGNLHIEQVSVHPDHARRGLGRSLLNHVAAQGRGEGLSAVTLTTFTDVPWNGPYYARCGFQPLDESTLTPGLREIRKQETAHGLDKWPRHCMRRVL
ncbi:MAG: GNAT family N-acetyltransferase [Micromonosporaceae bacterium]